MSVSGSEQIHTGFSNQSQVFQECSGPDPWLSARFEPDFLVPVQFFDLTRRRSMLDGETRLLFAVLDHVSERVQGKLAQSERIAPNGRPALGDLLRHLWAVYGDPEYWAVWEIIIGTRAEPRLHRRIVAHRDETMREVVYPWLARHSRTDAHPDALAIFELMLIAIRGLSLERFLDKDGAYLGRNLVLLGELVERRLAGAAPARSSGRRVRLPAETTS